MYCSVDCPCRTQRDSELLELKDQMQFIVHTLGIKNIFKTHMRSQGPSSVGEKQSHRSKPQRSFPLLLRWTLRPRMHGSAEVNL